MNVIRGTLNQNRKRKKWPALGKRRFEVQPVFQRVRSRITPQELHGNRIQQLNRQSITNENDNLSNTIMENDENFSNQQFTEPTNPSTSYSYFETQDVEEINPNENYSNDHSKRRNRNTFEFKPVQETEFNNNNNIWNSNSYSETVKYDSSNLYFDDDDNNNNDVLESDYKNINEKQSLFDNNDWNSNSVMSINQKMFTPVNIHNKTNHINNLSLFNNGKNTDDSSNNNLRHEHVLSEFSNDDQFTKRHEVVSNESIFLNRHTSRIDNNDTKSFPNNNRFSESDNNEKFRTPIPFKKQLQKSKQKNSKVSSNNQLLTSPMFIRNNQMQENLKVIKNNDIVEDNCTVLSNNQENSSNEPADLVTRILRTPVGNRNHYNTILPLLTSSSERGTCFNTPVTANKHIQSLLPLNSFPDSGSGSGRRNKSSTSSGPQPLTTPSERLRTPRSTTNSNESGHYTILAITEGRGLARGEVGIAVMDVKRPQLVLCQITDAQTYTNTLTKVNYFNPVEILIPHTFVEAPHAVKLFSILNDNFPHANLTTVQRKHFNDKVGLNQIQNLCLPEYLSVELIIKHKFYALSAAAALIKYVEFTQTVIFSKRSIKIEYQGAEDIMTIDMDSAKQLELVLCNSGGGYEKSLLGILNHCSTVSGRRFLRANILQPPYNQQLTETRLNCVTELVEDPALLASLKGELVKFEDVEQLLWLSVQLPSINAVDRPSEVQMNFILLLKTTLVALPGLIESLKDAKATYFHSALSVLRDGRYNRILEIIHNSINEDARVVKGFMASQHQRCFAIKPEVNGLLDVARNTYSSLIEETHNKVLELSREYDLPLKLSSSNSKGMHIQLNVTRNMSFNIKDLPSVFIQVTRVGKHSITCTTEEILILNQRMKHALREIQLMSNAVVAEILQKMREYIGCLYRLCEVIAELDILLAFALVSSSTDFVRPNFSAELDVISSRHPILDVISSSRPVGNDVVASSEVNFHLITGPNMGGKSIYIRQIALLQIMAQIGCYVPAKSAQFCLIRNLFTRIGFDDSIEHNASTFKLEMWQMKYILQSAALTNHKSLIIVDELCRGTCCEEGTAIAWSLCQELAALNAFTFFTTHFHFLTQLENVQSNIKNWHFEAELNDNGQLKYTHRLLPGVTTISNYGIQLAKLTSLPDSVMKLILEVKDELTSRKEAITESNLEDEMDPESDWCKILATKFVDLIRNGKCIEEIITDIEEFISRKLITNSENIDNDSGSYRSNNTVENLCNVEVQLEEMDIVVDNNDNINNSDNNDDSNSVNNNRNSDNITTQDCIDMLQDTSVSVVQQVDDPVNNHDRSSSVNCISNNDNNESSVIHDNDNNESSVIHDNDNNESSVIHDNDNQINHDNANTNQEYVNQIDFINSFVERNTKEE